MLKRVEIEAKTLNEATKKAIEILRLPESKVQLTVLKEKKGILGIGGSTTYVATPNIELATEGKIYLDAIIAALDIDAKMEFRTADQKTFHYRIQSDQNAILIGREGRTLFALQTLLRNHLSSFVNEPLLVSLDIGNYHESRKRQLEILATKTAKEVARTKIAVRLDPMNAFDRRIIHEKLSDWRDVVTESEGEGESRAIHIKPKKH